ncbi:unnamed protein product [Rhodiola kirilowii]
MLLIILHYSQDEATGLVSGSWGDTFRHLRGVCAPHDTLPLSSLTW